MDTQGTFQGAPFTMIYPRLYTDCHSFWTPNKQTYNIKNTANVAHFALGSPLVLTLGLWSQRCLCLHPLHPGHVEVGTISSSACLRSDMSSISFISPGLLDFIYISYLCICLLVCSGFLDEDLELISCYRCDKHGWFIIPRAWSTDL